MSKKFQVVILTTNAAGVVDGHLHTTAEGTDNPDKRIKQYEGHIETRRNGGAAGPGSDIRWSQELTDKIDAAHAAGKRLRVTTVPVTSVAATDVVMTPRAWEELNQKLAEVFQ
jgi:hypothetical protein